MLDIYPLPMNINQLKKIPSAANINIDNSRPDIFEYNNKKADI